MNFASQAKAALVSFCASHCLTRMRRLSLWVHSIRSTCRKILLLQSADLSRRISMRRRNSGSIGWALLPFRLADSASFPFQISASTVFNGKTFLTTKYTKVTKERNAKSQLVLSLVYLVSFVFELFPAKYWRAKFLCAQHYNK